MKYIVTINEKNYEVEVEKGVAQVLAVIAAAPVVFPSPVASPAAPQSPAAPAPAVAPTYAPVNHAAGEALRAPMPGTVINVLKKPGDVVVVGEIVILLEAMKMENEIVATKSGTITQVLVSKGTIVTTGNPLVMVV